MDQILPHSCKPTIYEGVMQDAKDYVQLAEAENGPLPRFRGAEYPWGPYALEDLKASRQYLTQLEGAEWVLFISCCALCEGTALLPCAAGQKA